MDQTARRGTSVARPPSRSSKLCYGGGEARRWASTSHSASWLAAPEWAQRELYHTLIEMARAALAARGWKRMYILLILKKKFSDLVCKRRDISVTSQELKLIDGLMAGGYKATQVRSHKTRATTS